MLEDEELETIVFSKKLWFVLCLNIAAAELGLRNSMLANGIFFQTEFGLLWLNLGFTSPILFIFLKK